jgi:hypothetical protein
VINKPTKRNKSKFLPAILLLLSLSVIVPPIRPAYACSCARPSAPNQALADATVVFSGQVTNIEQVKGRLNVTFRVDEQWKGNSAQSLVIQTTATTAMCGYAFEVGQTYLVYAHHRQGRLQTNQCSRTTILSQAAEDLSVLSKDKPCKGWKGGKLKADAIGFRLKS